MFSRSVYSQMLGVERRRQRDTAVSVGVPGWSLEDQR